MPVDAMFVDPMLGTFRGMMLEMDQKQLTGANVDEMRAVMNQMEGLAQQHSDFAAFSGELTQHQCFQRFSDAYGRALGEAAKASAGGPGGKPSDAEMLENMVSAYEQTMAMYQSGQAGDQGMKLLPVITQMVQLGRSGVSFPVYLRMLEEQGLTKALEGSGVVLRPSLVAAIQEAAKHWRPHEYAEVQAELAAYDEMAAAAPFGLPDSFALSLRFRRIEWEYAPRHAWWDALIRRWSYMIDVAWDWLDSFASFAPYDERWLAKGNPARTKKNIRRTQECGPGNFLYRNAVMHRYFQMTINDVWAHDSFTYEYTARRIHQSDERLQLVRDTIPHIAVGAKPPAELVQRAEQLHGPKDYRPDRAQPLPPGSVIENPFR